ncbi:MAG TPA: alpha/beta fold hydrolase [Ktedonobacteraceae bacterium]
MSKSAGLTPGRWAVISVSMVLASMGMVALLHALETPQPLKSELPGEAHLYRWRRRSIFYKVLGAAEAPPLVLLHRPEIGASGHEMARIMAPLAETYRVYTLDLLGFGLSDRPGVEYSTELYNTLCQDFLREIVGGSATLLASGLSCNYAVAVAASAPELCASLILISPSALQGKQPIALTQYAEQPLIKALLYPLLSTYLAFRLTNRLQQTLKEDFARFYANTRQLGAEHAAMARVAGRLTDNVEAQFERLQQPVLMIWGTQALDSQPTVANLQKATALANPRQARKVELVQGAALVAHTEQPEDVVNMIRHWQQETSFSLAASLDKASTGLNGEKAAEPATASGDEIEKGEVIAYCVKCKQRRKMLNAHKVIMKNGRPAMRGACSVCGSGINRIGDLN